MVEQLRRAEVRDILPNDAMCEGEVLAESADPYDDSGWFSVDVGFEGEEGVDIFQVCVATPKAMRSLSKKDKKTCFLVDRYDSASIESALRERIGAVEGFRWIEVVEELRTFMLWEFG